MVAWNWGLNVYASSTVQASPAPTITTCRLTTITDFHEDTRIQIKVGGFFEQTFITNISGNDITFSPALSAPPDTGGASLCEDRSEIIVWEKLQSMTDAINDNMSQVQLQLTLALKYLVDLQNSRNDFFGNGQDGPFWLGPISNPTGSQTPTISLNGAGLISGLVSVAIEAYNFSGVTLATSNSAQILATNNSIEVTIPSWASTNISGFNIFLKIGAGPNFLVAKVTRDYNNPDTPYSGLVVTINTPMTSGAAPTGSNTTSHNATLSGVYKVHGGGFGQSVAQIITVANPGLIILSDTDFEEGSFGQINANGIGGLKNGYWISSNNNNFYTYGQAAPSAGQGTGVTGSGFPGLAAPYLLNRDGWDWLNTQGGLNTGSVNQAGGTVILGAKNTLFLHGANSANGTAGTTAGCSGGLLAFIGGTISRGGAVNNANGANAVGSRAGGGGGGIILYLYNLLFGTATNNANGGLGGPVGGGTQVGGGAFGGDGGASGTGTGAGNPGSAGLIIERSLSLCNLPRF